MALVSGQAILIVLALVAYTDGTFLAPSQDFVSRTRVVDELQSILGHLQHTERLAQVEGILRPTFVAMPKNQLGGLEHRVARHALYRYFLVHHGWYINGLALEMDDKISSSSDMLSKSQMPTFIMELLEEQVKHKGIGLKDLAVLAVTMEHLVHSEGVDLLTLSYTVHGISTSDVVGEKKLDLIIQTFLMFLILPETVGQNRKAILRILGAPIRKAYPGWDEALLWANDMRQAFLYQDRSGSHPFAPRESDFSTVVELATQIKAEWGRFADVECKMLKNKLMDLEDSEVEDGRVRLSQFYGPYLDNISFHFSEGPDYLRHIGALDDFSPRGASVIVPNLLYAQSNCLSASGFHSVCCIDTCESVISVLEHQVSGSSASPATVAAAVATIPSETVSAPRNLSAPLVQRLDVIANKHGGQIPLHSRLFSEWLHFAFPNECSHPRSLRTKEAQLTRDEWEARNGRNMKATQEEMSEFVTEVRNRQVLASAEASQVPDWSDDEELLGELVEPPATTVLSVLRLVAGLCVLLGSVASLIRSAPAGQLGGKQGPWASFVGKDDAPSVHFV